MSRSAFVGLIRFDLPERTVAFADGGTFTFDGRTFSSRDEVFGTVEAAQALSEGVGDEVPALSVTLLPDEGSAPSQLSKPGHQRSRVRFWLQEFDPATGQITTNDPPLFDGQVDQTNFTVGHRERRLTMSIVSLAEQLFEGDIGNSMSPTFHKSVWPGEQGHDNATGLVTPVAWGIEAPQMSSSSRGSGGGGGFANYVIRTALRAY